MFWLTVLNQVEPALVLIRPTLGSASQGSTKVPNIAFLPDMRSGILAGSGPALDPAVALDFPRRRPPRQHTSVIA